MDTACSPQDLATTNGIAIGCAKHWEGTISIHLSASLMRQIYHARGKGCCQERLIPMNDMWWTERENVKWLTNNVDIVNMAVETSLQHKVITTLTVSPCLLIYFAQAEEGKGIYFRSGRSEADDRFKVYQSIVWKKLSEMLSISLQK